MQSTILPSQRHEEVVQHSEEVNENLTKQVFCPFHMFILVNILYNFKISCIKVFKFTARVNLAYTHTTP